MSRPTLGITNNDKQLAIELAVEVEYKYLKQCGGNPWRVDSRENRFYVGFLGEIKFCHYLNIPFKPVIYEHSADQGFDVVFEGYSIDVKSTHHIDGYLLVGKKVESDFISMVELDLCNDISTFMGFLDREHFYVLKKPFPKGVPNPSVHNKYLWPIEKLVFYCKQNPKENFYAKRNPELPSRSFS